MSSIHFSGDIYCDGVPAGPESSFRLRWSAKSSGSRGDTGWGARSLRWSFIPSPFILRDASLQHPLCVTRLLVPLGRRCVQTYGCIPLSVVESSWDEGQNTVQTCFFNYFISRSASVLACRAQSLEAYQLWYGPSWCSLLVVVYSLKEA